MYSKKLEAVFTPQALRFALKNYQKARDYNTVRAHIDSGAFVKELREGFVPDPVRSFEIDKNDHEKRQLALSSTASKIVQKILVQELEDLVTFSDRSYAYRKNKGTVKAINRTKDFLKKNFWVAKADIDNFFDTIDQKLLIEKLNRHIQDKRIVRLIAVFLKNGMLKQNSWIDKHIGVYQGDNLSPWLSNFYLNDFDHHLEKKHIDFIRYADDMLFFARHRRDAIKAVDLAEGYLSSLSLTFGKDKSLISNKKEGFAYLGLWFKEDRITMDNHKLQKKISKLSQKTQKRPLSQCIDVINEHIEGVQRYYARILTDEKQFEILQKHIDEILVKKIAEAKKSKQINKKSRFIQLLTALKSYRPVTAEVHDKHIRTLIARAYEQIALQTPLKTATKEVAKSKTHYLKENVKSHELILAKYGLFAGVTKGKVIVKEYGKVVKQLPLNTLSRVIILSPGINISSMLIYQCSKRKIDIDFIYRDEPYAQILYYKSVSSALHRKQLHFISQPNARKIAATIVKILTDRPDFTRTTQNAPDTINQAINYGYGFLYQRIQSAIVKAGLSLYHSFLHTEQSGKPTLVFDLIEEFRQPVVDREIISILNRNIKLTSAKGRLTQQSVKVISQNIQERLVTPSKWRKGKYQLADIIDDQVLSLAHTIANPSKRYKGFVARY